MTKSFNINNTVKVKLTEHGKHLLERDWNEFWSSHGKLDEYPYRPKHPDKDGYVRFQLWDLMYKLGKYCGLGCEPPFDTVILIDDEDLKDG